jgi:isopentenyl-diphosphate delta-isomerase
MSTNVVLVDIEDRETGICEKIAAHSPPAQLHRAFSLFLFNPHGRLLIQQRSLLKYHFAGLWANSCCGHPAPGESVLDAASNRCLQELGFAPQSMLDLGIVRYQADDPISGLQENELDHVITGFYIDTPRPNPDEVAAIRSISIDELVDLTRSSPRSWAPWLPPTLHVVRSHLAAG